MPDESRRQVSRYGPDRSLRPWDARTQPMQLRATRGLSYIFIAVAVSVIVTLAVLLVLLGPVSIIIEG